MLWGLVVILILFWFLGVSVFSLGSLVHILLVIALVVIVYNLVVGRKPVP